MKICQVLIDPKQGLCCRRGPRCGGAHRDRPPQATLQLTSFSNALRGVAATMASPPPLLVRFALACRSFICRSGFECFGCRLAVALCSALLTLTLPVSFACCTDEFKSKGTRCIIPFEKQNQRKVGEGTRCIVHQNGLRPLLNAKKAQDHKTHRINLTRLRHIQASLRCTRNCHKKQSHKVKHKCLCLKTIVRNTSNCHQTAERCQHL